MADFYDILKGAIAELKAESTSERAALYARARVMLEKRLDALDPPLSAAARQQRHEALEEAVRQVEAELAEAADEAKQSSGPPGQPESAQGNRKNQDIRGTADGSPADKAPPKQRKMGKTKGDKGPTTRSKGGSRGQDGDTAATARTASSRKSGGVSAQPRQLARLVVPAVLLLLAFGGAFAYWQWGGEAGQSAVMLGFKGEEPEAAKLAATDVTARPAESSTEGIEPTEKTNTARPRVLSGSEPSARDDEPDTPISLASSQADNAVQSDATAQITADAQSLTSARTGTSPSSATPQVETVARLDKDQSRAPEATVPTERAFFIIEEDQPGIIDKRYDGSAVWQISGSGADMKLAVTAAFPERSLNMSVILRPNRDEALPASHAVDVLYKGPPDPAEEIAELIGMMVRSSEHKLTVPLQGAGASVTPGQFLFALSGRPADREHNVSQLKMGDWLLVRMRLESGQKSTVAIEKGETGKKAMAQAFTAWQQAQTVETN